MNMSYRLRVYSLLLLALAAPIAGWISVSRQFMRDIACPLSSTTTTCLKKSRISFPSRTAATTLSLHQRRDILETFFKMTFLASGVVVSLSLLQPTSPALAAYIDPATDPPTITKRVYLDVSFDNAKGEATSGRIVVGLFGDAMPKTVDNFVTLCASNAYAGTSFYRVISDFSIQGGAIGDATGRTGKSSLENGKGFEPDNYNIKHTKTGLISMVKGLDGVVDSRFFINCSDNGGWGDDRYAAFGIVEKGLDLVKQIELVPVQPPKNAPKSPVKIVASGVV
ncbi:peptidyl-prolyl cis-trans isomerase [Nitzschia inconspicua]|uniref:Peptidyl-prolyl cis-trans isomerase n=1 Tax=Nitzschia inconspicua TaxID=303405 RepID=A0A9K3KW77_9STRA|nr:peptidyl-prolyl cis-trans isomerase [Nitzschia inconspicua]